MRHVPCPLCKSNDCALVGSVHDRLLGIDGEFTMVRCTHCGLHYLNPQPTLIELEDYYPETYDPFQTKAPAELSVLQRISVNYGLSKRRRAVMRHKTGGRLLEIGCARGLFLDTMQQTGNWHTYGVETSELAAQYARDRLGLDVFCGTLEEANLPDHHFDAIVMWDVLEHIATPRETLTEIHRVIRPDGVFVFRLPLLDSWDQKLFGPYWVGCDAPRHLTVFSRHTLESMLRHSGFDIERTACVSGGYPAFVLSLRFWLQDRLSAQMLDRAFRILESLPVRLATSPYFYLVDRLGKSTVVTVTARPQAFAQHPETTEVY